MGLVRRSFAESSRGRGGQGGSLRLPKNGSLRDGSQVPTPLCQPPEWDSRIEGTERVDSKGNQTENFQFVGG